jgi:hypothetical protein
LESVVSENFALFTNETIAFSTGWLPSEIVPVMLIAGSEADAHIAVKNKKQ